MGAGKRNPDHKHPKITAKHDQASCTSSCCSMAKKTGREENRHEGGSGKEVVRRHRSRVDSGDVPSEPAGAVMVRQQRHDPHHKKYSPGDEQDGDVYKSSSHLNKSTALVLSSRGNSESRKESSDVNCEPKANTRNVQPSIASHLSKFSFFTNSILGSNSASKNPTINNILQKHKDNNEKMDFATQDITSTRRHRSSSVGKILDDDLGRVHRHLTFAPKTEKEREKERERLKLKLREGKGVKPERRFSSSDRDRDGSKAPKEAEREKLRIRVNSLASKEKYEAEKAERKHRKKERKEEEEKETERPQTAPVALTEQNLGKCRDLIILKEKRSKSKSKGTESTPKTPSKSRSSVSTEEPITRRDKSGREQLILYETSRFDKKEHSRHSNSKDIIDRKSSSKTSESHHEHTIARIKVADCRHCEQEKREREKAMESKKEKRRDESSMKTREQEKDKGKGTLLGFTLQKKDKMVTCVTCLSDDVPRHQAAKLSCSHYFCNECLKRIFQLSLTDPAHMPPKCCTEEHIPLKHVDRLLPYQTKKLWNKKYVEYTTSNRIYCPTRDCGEWIQPSNIAGKTGRCARCRTRVCTMCNGNSHGTEECPKDEDLKAFVETARKNGYQRCHSCRAVVELEKGCNHITCRCTAEFCYVCGSKWKTCECPWFNYEPESDDDDEGEMREETDDDIYVTPVWSDEEHAGPSHSHHRRNRTRNDQIAEDEALARRLQKESLLMSEEEVTEDLGGGYQIQIGPTTPSGTIGRGIKNEFKRLAAEYAETSKRDDEAREERVRQRLQRLRERDAARHGQYQQEIKARRESTSSRRPETREGPSKLEPRSVPTQPPVHEETPEEVAERRRLYTEEQAARIARYIMSDDVDSDDEPIVAPIPRPSTSYTPSPKPVAEPQSSPRHADYPRSRRTTAEAPSPKPERRMNEASRISAEKNHTPSTSRTTVSGLPRSMARLDNPPCASSLPPTNTSPLASAAAAVRETLADTTTKYTHTNTNGAAAAANASMNADTNTNTHTSDTTRKRCDTWDCKKNVTDVGHGNMQYQQEKVIAHQHQHHQHQHHQHQHQHHQHHQQQNQRAHRGPVAIPQRSTTYPFPQENTYSYRMKCVDPATPTSSPHKHKNNKDQFTPRSWKGMDAAWSLPETFINKLEVTPTGRVLLPRKY